jgi:hypothetical protein
MGSHGILLANAIDMQYCWQASRPAGSRDCLGEGLGAGAGPNRPLGRSGGDAAEVPEGTKAVGSMGECLEVRRRGLRGNRTETGEKTEILLARGQGLTEVTGRDVGEYLEACRAEGKRGTSHRRG